ncbi:hypothetical protein D9M68_664470 [compost metagenome]
MNTGSKALACRRCWICCATGMTKNSQTSWVLGSMGSSASLTESGSSGERDRPGSGLRRRRAIRCCEIARGVPGAATAGAAAGAAARGTSSGWMDSALAGAGVSGARAGGSVAGGCALAATGGISGTGTDGAGLLLGLEDTRRNSSAWPRGARCGLDRSTGGDAAADSAAGAGADGRPAGGLLAGSLPSP